MLANHELAQNFNGSENISGGIMATPCGDVAFIQCHVSCFINADCITELYSKNVFIVLLLLLIMKKASSYFEQLTLNILSCEN